MTALNRKYPGRPTLPPPDQPGPLVATLRAATVTLLLVAAGAGWQLVTHLPQAVAGVVSMIVGVSA